MTEEVDALVRALEAFGTDLTSLAEAGTLPHAYCAAEQCEVILNLLRREPWRSIALLGAAGTGKSAIVNELVYELAKPENGKWRVLRVSPADFMAGTRYLGEWETKVRNLIDLVKKPRRVVIYVPNLSELSAAGTWSRSQSSVATALAPYMEEGSVLLLGESAPEEFERGIGRIPSLQRLFDRVLVPEATKEQTHEILAAVRDEQGIPLDDDVLEQLLEASDQFLGHISRPGSAVMMLRALANANDLQRKITFRDVLDSLSKSTGIPTDLLDDAKPVDPADVREFFEKKIIGQPEAVQTVVDLVALIKAGLTDPQKPYGVFLFVGPTGVGKTELARALAEFIFGDAKRLERFDMSEFASGDGFQRLIGDAIHTGLLTDAVRQHPFSVILLDEIEKSHTNVFDLCLQIFDAGRLTDGRGRTADFRRTIVILTSNIGATGPTTPLGFGANAQPSMDVDKDKMFRELSRFFRPEFLNRLDRIVQFRPLSLEVAEQIARREVDSVLQRSGIRRRQLTIDIDPSVISFLVREGYSPHFGARPLKRTVERLLLLPLARAISAGSIREQTILHVKRGAGGIQVVVARPGAEIATSSKKQKQPRVLGKLQSAIDELRHRFAATESRVRTLAERKSKLLEQTQQPGFYRDPALRKSTFGEIHKLDQFLELWRGLGVALEGFHGRLGRSVTRTDEAVLNERLEQLSSELEQLILIAGSENGRDLADALVCVSLVDSSGRKQSGVEKVVEMYLALAKRRRMAAEILGEFVDGKHDRAYLSIEGLGAYSTFKHEAGLHQFEHRTKLRAPRNSRETLQSSRESIRVEVMTLENELNKRFRNELKSKITTLKPTRKRLINANLAISVFHEPSLRSLEFWTTGSPKHALERASLVLHAQLSDDAEATPKTNEIVRYYDLGISPCVRDARTGRSTTRVDRIFKGQLGSILPALV